MEIKDKLKALIAEALTDLAIEVPVEIHLECPANPWHGDYAANSALALSPLISPDSPNFPPSPQALAQAIVNRLELKVKKDPDIDKVQAVAGFINFYLSDDFFLKQLSRVLKEKQRFGQEQALKSKKIMVEYAHPNTHKEMHIGHLRTLIVGETLARIFEACGAQVFRANYQGDIGPHVAKALWGLKKILSEKNLSWQQAEKLSLGEKAHLLGQAYVLGSRSYQADQQAQAEIDKLNQKLYQGHSRDSLYQRTRQWSLDYYDQFYQRFGTRFDRLYFESQVAQKGKAIVLQHLDSVFEKSQGAMIFNGEKYDLHRRVFITQAGHPTYEAKEMGLAQQQFSDFPFDLNLHVVGGDQAEYFKVTFQALSLIDGELGKREAHLPMGMIQLKGVKMSSRTGEIITVDGLLDEVKELARPLISAQGLTREETDSILQQVVLAAVKYSVLKVDPRQNVVFEPSQSVSLQGNSGPYLQYTYARARAILQRVQKVTAKPFVKTKLLQKPLERQILRLLYQFPEVVQEAAQDYAPNLVCNYLFSLAQEFNSFYEKERVIGSEQEDLRLALVQGVAQAMENGLYLLGIEALKRM